MKFIKLIIIHILLTNNLFCKKLEINKVIIWGHKLHSHTHSYIHYGFFRAFEYLGYKTFWFDDNDNFNNFDFSNSLFLTEGNVDKNIPLREDCFYILHNCNQKYNNISKNNRIINLQVYTNDCDNRKLQKLEDCIFYDLEQKIIYMPWATDLLPHEIEENKKNILKNKKENVIYWIGTIGDGIFGNINELNPFIKACKENNIEFKQFICNKTTLENVALIKSSFMAPAIQGNWQCQKGYIPCRIFKNISYGQFGITNSETVYKLFNKKIIYNKDTFQLFYDAKKRLENININELYELMDFVKNNHTFINRINHLIKFLELINK